MYKPLKRIKGLRHRFGSQDTPVVDLPSQATVLPPRPAEELTVDLEIGAFSDGGYLFVCRSPILERSWDNWYETLEQAFECGFDAFGVGPADWEDVE